MRTLVVISAAGLALAACDRPASTRTASANAGGEPSAAKTSVAAAGLPARRPGLWIQTITRDGKAAGVGGMRMCVDAVTDARMMAMGQKMGKGACQQRTLSRGLDGSYAMVSTCSMGQAGTFASRGTVTGDFSTKYHVHSESDITGATYAPMNGHHVTEIDGVYAGPCPADMAPGDIALANGIKINPGKFAGAAAGGPAGGD